MKLVLSCAATLALVIFSGCTVFRVGPDYKESDFIKETGMTNLWTEGVGKWWESFNDPILTNLIANAIATNRNLMVASANIREARAQVGIAKSVFFPGLDGRGSYKRYGLSENSNTMPVGNIDRNLYSGGFDATWEWDIFGGNYRQLEAVTAGLEAVQARYDSVMVSLMAEVASTYVNYRTAQRCLDVAYSNVVIQTDTYDMVASREKSGLVNALPAQQALYNLETTRSVIPTLEQEMDAAANALAVLTGILPGSLQEMLKPDMGIPAAPRQVLAYVPAEAIRRRPDVRVAERLVAAAVAEIGVARSDLYPKFALNGNVGLESLKWSTWDNSKSMAYSFGPQFSWAIFKGGSIRSNIAAKTAAQEAILASYEQTVLSALQEIADAMYAYDREAERLKSLTLAVEAAKRAVAISNDLFKQGLVTFNDVLDAQRSLASLEERLALCEGSISRTLVRVYKSLGGEWDWSEEWRFSKEQQELREAHAKDVTVVN